VEDKEKNTSRDIEVVVEEAGREIPRAK